MRNADVASATPAQRKEQEEIVAVRAQVKSSIGDPHPEDARSLEKRAEQVGLSLLYDVIYRYASAVTHPTLRAIDVVSERRPKDLLNRGEPTAQFVSLSPLSFGVLLRRRP